MSRNLSEVLYKKTGDLLISALVENAYDFWILFFVEKRIKDPVKHRRCRFNADFSYLFSVH